MLKRLTIRGFKSIRALEDFELRNLNVLIGANGAGKSNFVAFLDMLSRLNDQRLQSFVDEQDGPDAMLFGGRKRTRRIETKVSWETNTYECSLAPMGRRFVFASETMYYGPQLESKRSLGSGHLETNVTDIVDRLDARFMLMPIGRWRVYHFHDTSASSAIRQAQPTRDNLELKPDAGNLAPFLRSLREQHPAEYRRVLDTVRLAAPFFGDFVYRENPGERMDLEWTEMSDPDTVRGPRQLSDGTHASSAWRLSCCNPRDCSRRRSSSTNRNSACIRTR